MKIYTKTGDSGTTGLFAGPRVSKDHPRIAAYGTVDELNAVLGLVGAEFAEAGNSVGEGKKDLAAVIEQIQHDLFSIGAQLATPDAKKQGMVLLRDSRVEELEELMDELDAGLEPLTNFILPGGTKKAALLHLARTVCRRAERDVVSLSHQEANCETLVVFLNRLSDLFFLLARKANADVGQPDVVWQKPE